jgi:hypothetical protein
MTVKKETKREREREREREKREEKESEKSNNIWREESQGIGVRLKLISEMAWAWRHDQI